VAEMEVGENCHSLVEMEKVKEEYRGLAERQ